MIYEKIIDTVGNNIVTLIIGTILGSEITRFLYKPNVIIRLRGLIPLFSDNGFFISIRIANRGRTVASESIGNITINFDSTDLMDPDIYKLDAFENSLPTYRLENIQLDFPRHQLVTPSKDRPIKNSSLCWSALGNPGKLNINPGSSENLDICRAQLYENDNDKFWYLIFPCEQGWRKISCRIKLRPGIPLTGKLFVCPNNVFPTVRKFTFILKNGEDRPTFVIRNYGFFQRIYYFFNRSKLYFD